MSDYFRSLEAQELGFDIDDERLVNELLGPYDGGVEPMEWDEVMPLEQALAGLQEEEAPQLPDSTTTGFEPCFAVSFDPTIRGGEEVVTSTTDATGEDLNEPSRGLREDSSPEDYVDSPTTEPVVDNPVDTLSIAFQQIGVGVWAPGMEDEQVRQVEREERVHLMPSEERENLMPPEERAVTEMGTGRTTAARKGKQRRENRKRKLEEEKEAKEHLHQRKMQKQRESRRKMRELAKKGRLLELQESIRTSAEELSVARSNISCPCCKTVVYFCLGLSGGAEDVGIAGVKNEEHSG